VLKHFNKNLKNCGQIVVKALIKKDPHSLEALLLLVGAAGIEPATS
jgi:hypothetical protein